METLPYFFDLLKHHALLYAIISTGSLSELDTSKIQYSRWSDKVIELDGFKLSQEENFEKVMITMLDSDIWVEFKTYNSKYFEGSNHYFGRDAVLQNRTPYFINDSEINVRVKDLGRFQLFGKDAYITIREYNKGDYSISIRFKSEQKHEDDQVVYVENFESSKNILGLFKPDEISMVKEYSSESNIPLLRIKLKSMDHPILKYYQYQASLLYQGNLYPNNQIPKINPLKVQELIFKSVKDIDGIESHQLEVVLSKKMLNGGEGVSFTTEPDIINFFSVDGNIRTRDELIQQNLDLDKKYKLVSTVFGKEACEKFGHTRYASGVAIYVKK